MSAASAPARTRAALARGAAFLACALALAGGARADEDREPIPPPIFFLQPDAPAAADIEEIVSSTFGDPSRAAEGREALVRRFGLWSVPALVQRVAKDDNETQAWNAALTLASLRRVHGPSWALWPAIPPLVDLLQAKKADPYRRAFAALALGYFYGYASVPLGTHEPVEKGDPKKTPEAPAARARDALRRGNAALVDAFLHDDHSQVRTAAALALAKIGGSTVWSQYLAALRTVKDFTSLDHEVASLVALGLLPGSDEARLVEHLSHSKSQVRAGAALAIACRATTDSLGGVDPDPQAKGRAPEIDRQLQPTYNASLRMNGPDGAEAVYARGMLAHHGATAAAWADLFDLATVGTTEPEAAVAAAQALLFCPDPGLAAKMAEAARTRGDKLEEPVLAAFLVRSGSDGTMAGIRACAEFLKRRDRRPVGRLEYDVRYHAAIGLVRALEAGRAEAVQEAVEALQKAAGMVLPNDPREPRTFRSVLDKEVLAPWLPAFAANPGKRLSPGSAIRLEGTFVDPDAMLAHDAIATPLDRLNDEVREIFGLNNLAKAAAGGGGGGGPRVVSKEDIPLRFLLRWLERYPYYTRLDLRRDRGRLPPPVAPTTSNPGEIDR